MEKLTRYDSYEALKADTNRTNDNPQETIKRNLELKQVIEHLRNTLIEKKKEEKHFSNPADNNE